MSDHDFDVVLDDETGDDGAPEAPTAPEPTPVVESPASDGSILGALNAEIQAAGEDDEFLVLPVGKIPRLYARYRALDDDEIEDINKRAKGRERTRRRTGQDDEDIEGRNQRGALLLARACERLLWLNDDGEKVDLHEALRAQGVDVDGPLRYDRRLAALLDLDDVGPEPSSSQIAMRLHRWGKSNVYAPLRGTAQLVELHASGLSSEALEAALQGN